MRLLYIRGKSSTTGEADEEAARVVDAAIVADTSVAFTLGDASFTEDVAGDVALATLVECKMWTGRWRTVPRARRSRQQDSKR